MTEMPNNKAGLKAHLIRNINKKILELRINQTQLSLKAGMPCQSIYKILKGIRTPTLIIIEKLSMALECTPAELLTDSSELGKFSIGREELSDLFRSALQEVKTKSLFSNLKKTSPAEVCRLVEKFGGWDFLYEYLVEELEIRHEAEKDYKKLKDCINENMTSLEVNEIKKRMIITKIIGQNLKRGT
jgi:DNA-binding Xre family transcriptional regulator